MPPQPLSIVLTHWSIEPSVLAGLVALAAGYVWLVRQPGMAVSRGRQIGFWFAVVLGALALLSPLDAISDEYLFSAHMLQHLILVLVVAPLVVRAIPIPIGRQLSIHPIVAFFVFNVVFAFSHAPVWYQATLVHPPLHIFEHALYLATGLLNWLPILNPAPERRLSPGPSMLYLFLETLPMFAVGSIISLSSFALYPFYAHAPRLLPISAVEDQSIAGLIMWIGGSFFYLGALTVVFFRWANQDIGLQDLEMQERLDQGQPHAA